MPEDRPIHVLIVDDNLPDVLLLKNALESAAVCDFRVIQHGDWAYEYLEATDSQSIPWPDLIVLDLNLPGRDGTELLELIRARPALAALTVAVVSSSPKDVLRKKAALADCYLNKPLELEEFLRMGQQIVDCHRARRLAAAMDSR